MTCIHNADRHPPRLHRIDRPPAGEDQDECSPVRRVLKTARIDFDLRFSCPAVHPSHPATGRSALSVAKLRTKQRRNRHARSDPFRKLDGLTENIWAPAMFVLSIAEVSRGSVATSAAVHDGVASVLHAESRSDSCLQPQSPTRRRPVRDRRLQPCGISRQEPDGVARVNDGFSPPAHKSRTAGDQNAHGGVHWITAQLSLGWPAQFWLQAAGGGNSRPGLPCRSPRTGRPSPQIQSPSAHN